MAADAVSRRARRFLAASAGYLVAWQAAALAGLPRRSCVVLAVYGFVLHAVFGKAYSLVPSYFDRTLATPAAPAIHLPLAALAAGCLAVEPLAGVPDWVGVAGAVLWAGGVAVFVGALAWTLRDNPTGRETGTGGPNAHRESVDRYANAFVPVALAYLLAGSYATLATRVGGPRPMALGAAPTAHLLAAGVAALLVFAVGFRLFPRFLVAAPPRALVAVVLPAGALGPGVLAWHFYGGAWFRVGAVLEAVAVIGFGAAYAALFARSERRRVGLYGPLAGGVCGLAGVGLGVHFAFAGVAGGLTAVHFRLNALGFLGLTIVGATYQFYPPTVGSFPGASDRTALASIGLVGAGLAAELSGAIAGSTGAVTAGRASALAGALLFASLIGGVFAER
ncbi:hypothetical protein [Halorussus marinus]|uniref:hypothetical protein n=1 Tax=Halorussus marinus TaxID=2505976 RepID=UPI00106E3352|nr:hypothetical protein [Halorussus marinus]